MSLKSVFFKLRDGLRFSWARRKYAYIPKGDIAAFDFHKLKHIVILKLDGKLGDTQVMSHFYSQLRNLSNDGQKLFLSVVCPSGLTHIYRDILGFDCVIESSRKPREQEITKICESIKQAARDAGAGDSVDLLISTEPAYRPRDFIFNKLLSPNYVAGCDKRIAGSRSEISYLLYDVDSYDKPVANAFCEFLAKGKVQASDIIYTRFCTDDDISKAKEYLRIDDSEAGVLVGINPSAASRSKLFKPDITASMLLKVVLSSDNARALLLCPRGMNEYISQVTNALGEHKCLVGSRILLMPEQTTACDLAALICCTSGQLGVDTATVHLACAAKIPQLCFYNNNNTESLRWAPVGSKAEVVKFAINDLYNIDKKLLLEPANKFIEELFTSC